MNSGNDKIQPGEFVPQLDNTTWSQRGLDEGWSASGVMADGDNG
jgi:hypothetical protein